MLTTLDRSRQNSLPTLLTYPDAIVIVTFANARSADTVVVGQPPAMAGWGFPCRLSAPTKRKIEKKSLNVFWREEGFGSMGSIHVSDEILMWWMQ